MTVNAALLTREYSGGRAVTGQANGVIYGTVELGMDGAPNALLQRKVQLYIARDGTYIAQSWSDPVTGAYRFELLDTAEKYFVIAFDHTGQHRAVVADGLVPEVMP